MLKLQILINEKWVEYRKARRLQTNGLYLYQSDGVRKKCLSNSKIVNPKTNYVFCVNYDEHSIL